jgi:hypothetical protein
MNIGTNNLVVDITRSEHLRSELLLQKALELASLLLGLGAKLVFELVDHVVHCSLKDVASPVQVPAHLLKLLERWSAGRSHCRSEAGVTRAQLGR